MHGPDVLIGKEIIDARLGMYDEKLILYFGDGTRLIVTPSRTLVGNNDFENSLNLTLKESLS
jgi:hypothetical protein